MVFYLVVENGDIIIVRFLYSVKVKFNVVNNVWFVSIFVI